MRRLSSSPMVSTALSGCRAETRGPAEARGRGEGACRECVELGTVTVVDGQAGGEAHEREKGLKSRRERRAGRRREGDVAGVPSEPERTR